ncbi:MAG: hypothetical protein RLP44_02010 [Aggregatilineales bacterium]
MKRRTGVVLTILLILGWVTIIGQEDGNNIQQFLQQGSQSVAMGELRYQADFATGAGWQFLDYSSRFVGTEAGRYRISHSSGVPIRATYEDDSFANSIILSKTTLLSEDPDAGYGVVCRGDPQLAGTGYYFFLRGTGFARIFTYERGAAINLTDWVAVPNMNTGQGTNEIMAVCSNRYLALYINGDLVAEAEDSTYVDGRVGFAAVNYITDRVVNVALNDFRVFESTLLNQEFVAQFNPTLQSVQHDWHATISELQRVSSIPEGGDLFYSESSASLELVGDTYEPLLGRFVPHNIVLSGEIMITATPSSGVQCGFVSRLQQALFSDETLSYFEFGANLLDDVITVYSEEENGDAVALENYPYDLQIGVPLNVLYILNGNRATIYVNRELIVSDLRIADHYGVSGLIMRAEETGGRCNWRNLWIYALPESQ